MGLFAYERKCYENGTKTMQIVAPVEIFCANFYDEIKIYGPRIFFPISNFTAGNAELFPQFYPLFFLLRQKVGHKSTNFSFAYPSALESLNFGVRAGYVAGFRYRYLVPRSLLFQLNMLISSM